MGNTFGAIFALLITTKNNNMESKHTKGEWQIKKPNNSQVFIKSEYSINGIAQINLYEEEAEANAKLIAAAPELLEALNELLLWANIKDGSSFQYLRDKAQNAINKATQ